MTLDRQDVHDATSRWTSPTQHDRAGLRCRGPVRGAADIPLVLSITSPADSDAPQVN